MPRRRPVLFLALLACLVGLGVAFQVFPLVALALTLALAVLVCWRFPLAVGTFALACGPFIGWIFSFSLQNQGYGERLFGGSIDVPLADLAALFGMASVFAWAGRTQPWRRLWGRLPFKGAYAALVAAHLLSALSSARPDPVGVAKFALRPVAFSYLAFVAAPVLLLRRWQDVRRSFGIFVGLAVFFAAQGFVSLLVDPGWSLFALPRARPLPIFGVYPIGMNHNVLAEWLVVAAPFALAFGHWTHDRRLRRFSGYAALACLLIALLTFARSAWIVVALEFVLAGLTVWREYLQRAWAWFKRLGWVFVAPFAGYMAWFSLRAQVASSTDARLMLSQIAWRWFSAHPLVGAGAGTFFSRVNETWSYRLLFGGGMDAHGILQKLAAETGLVGLAAYALVSAVVARLAWNAIRSLGWRHRMGQGLVFAGIGMVGAWTYQLFNTTYWSAKLWLPVGLFFAAAALARRSRYE